WPPPATTSGSGTWACSEGNWRQWTSTGIRHLPRLLEGSRGPPSVWTYPDLSIIIPAESMDRGRPRPGPVPLTRPHESKNGFAMIRQSIKDAYFLAVRYLSLPNTWIKRIRYRLLRPQAPEGFYVHLGCGHKYLDGLINTDGNLFCKI